MDEELTGLAEKLNRAIRSTEEYQEYSEIREKIIDDEKTRKMLKDYKEKLMKARSKQMQGEELDEETRQELQEIQNYVDLNKNVRDYMEAEHEINLLIQELYQAIFSDLEIGLKKAGEGE